MTIQQAEQAVAEAEAIVRDVSKRLAEGESMAISDAIRSATNARRKLSDLRDQDEVDS